MRLFKSLSERVDRSDCTGKELKLNRLFKNQGFSLYEVLGVMTILGLLSVTGLQQYAVTLQSFRKMEAIQKFKSDVRRAKLESLAQGGHGALISDSGINGYRMGIDYFPYGSSPAIENELFAASLNERILLSLSAPLIFDSRGFMIDETGVPTSAAFSFSYDGVDYCSGTIYSSGVVEATCDNE